MTHHLIPHRARLRGEDASSRARGPQVLALAMALTLPACAAAAGGQGPPDTQTAGAGPYAGYPDSLAVVGHSQATGENTVPYEDGDTKTNTWVSGTNPAVRSVY